MKLVRKNLLKLYNFDYLDYEKDLSTKSPSYFSREGFKLALNTFQEAAVRVPAYKDFLRKNKVDPNKIKTFEKFRNSFPKPYILR